jgi:hypothetical protein
MGKDLMGKKNCKNMKTSELLSCTSEAGGRYKKIVKMKEGPIISMKLRDKWTKCHIFNASFPTNIRRFRDDSGKSGAGRNLARQSQEGGTCRHDPDR